MLAGGEELLHVTDDAGREAVLAEAIAHRVRGHAAGREIELRGEVVADGACERVVEGGVVAGPELLAGTGDRLPRRPTRTGEARVAHVARQSAPAAIDGRRHEPCRQRQQQTPG